MNVPPRMVHSSENRQRGIDCSSWKSYIAKKKRGVYIFKFLNVPLYGGQCTLIYFGGVRIFQPRKRSSGVEWLQKYELRADCMGPPTRFAEPP
jgi:hypothetical protein